MAQPISLPAAFDGMVQDFERNNLPKGRAWNIVDMIAHVLGAPLEERGGWGWAAPSLTAVDASAASVRAMVEAPFTGGVQIVVIDNLGNLIKQVGGANTLIGAAVVPVQNPFMHQQVVVIPSPDGSTAPKKYDGTSVAALGASAPAGKYGCVFVNYTWLGGAAASPQTGYASAVGDPGTYVTSGTSASLLNASFSIKGMAALPNVMLWFGDEKTARIRGTTPPPGTDMQMDDPIFNLGCVDARSIAVNGAWATFANAQGFWLTNGTATPEELTKTCGISMPWRAMMSNYNAANWTISSGWLGSYIFVSVMNGSTFVDAFLFDSVQRTVVRLSNVQAACFAAAGSAGQELYAGSRVTPRVMTMSSIFTPGASFKNDADGTPVLGTWESPFYDTGKIAGSQRWRWGYLEHDLRDAATDNPTWTIFVCTSPEAGAAYTSLGTIAESTARRTDRLPINLPNNGMGFKLTRQNAASFARIFGLAAVAYSREKNGQ